MVAAREGEQTSERGGADPSPDTTEVIAILGHELRNPLAAIQAALDVERLDPEPAVAARLRPAIQRQISHLTRLVDDLLDISRITHGRIELERRYVDLRDVVRDAVAAADARTHASGHRLIVHADDQPLPVLVDPTRIEQVIDNLVDNAIKYSEPGPIEVKLERSTPADGGAAQAVLSIRDYGIGIPADALERIFDLFVQLDAGLHRRTRGLGLGLTLVQCLVSMHGGTVCARSDGPGTGTELTVTLPLTEAPLDAERPRAPVPPSRETEPDVDRRILLVEDNDDLREMVRWVLERHGFVVLEATSGADGIEIALHEHPPVALVDIGLPGVDGFEVARCIRSEGDAHAPPMRLIAMTGYGSTEDRDRALAAGFDTHLVKPVDADDLIEAIASPRARRENAPVT